MSELFVVVTVTILIGAFLIYGGVDRGGEMPPLDHMKNEPDEGSPHTIHGPDK